MRAIIDALVGIFVGIILSVLLLGCDEPASTMSLRDKQACAEKIVEKEFMWVASHGEDGAMQYTLPRVVVLETEDFIATYKAFGGSIKPRSRLMGFQFGWNIYLWAGLDLENVSDQGIVIHEMGHYVRWRDGWYFPGNPNYIEGEFAQETDVRVIERAWVKANWPDGIPCN